jgi:hypothetical protein
MSFSLRNAAQTFERIMDVLLGVDFCFTYLDDILVFSRSLEEQEQHLWVLLDHLQTYEILVNPVKCLPGIRGHLPRLQSVRREFPTTGGMSGSSTGLPPS